MQLTAPRIQPLPESEWNNEAREMLEGLRRDGQVFNIFATLIRHHQLLKKWLVFAGYILGGSMLPPRQRELVILRVGWLCRAEYEWGHHVVIGKQAGLTNDDIRRTMEGPDAPGLEAFDAVLLKAVDELHAKSNVSNEVWSALSSRYSTEQLMDLLFTVGQYKLVSMVLNTIGIQLEAGFEGFGDEAQR
jgi:4-carboxymuconolactone decarboxylase